MDKYTVKFYKQAFQDLDEIYGYIANTQENVQEATALVDRLEEAIQSLDIFPERGVIRREGIYANKDYRQIFVKRYCIIYRVLKEQKEVHIITIRHVASQF